MTAGLAATKKSGALGGAFWKMFAALAAQNVIVLGVNMLDSIMLGGYSEAALTGAAVVNQIQYLLNSILSEAGTGLVVLASQYWGQNRTGPIRRLAAASMATGLCIALVFLGVTSFWPRQVLGLFTQDAAILQEGLAYLSILRFSFPLFALSTMLLALLRAVGTVRLALAVSAVALVANGILNYLFIYGGAGLPAMGAAGAALATVLARALECAIVVVYVFARDKKLRMKLRDFFAFDRLLAKDYLKATLPLLLNGFLWGISVALQTVILGRLSANAIAANSIATNCTMVLRVLSVAMASASAVLIGQAVGRGDLSQVKAYTRRLQGTYLVLGLCVCAAVLLVTQPLLSLYSISAESRRLAGAFFIILAFTSIGTAYQVPVLTGIIVGGGDTRFNTINNIVCVWFILLPLSFLAAFVFHWPAEAVVLCLNSDQIYKCLPAVIKVNRYNWAKTLTRKDTG